MTTLRNRMHAYVDENLGYVIVMAFAAFAAVLLGWMFWNLHWIDTQWRDFSAKCEARGGFVLRGECLDKRARISVE